MEPQLCFCVNEEGGTEPIVVGIVVPDRGRQGRGPELQDRGLDSIWHLGSLEWIGKLRKRKLTKGNWDCLRIIMMWRLENGSEYGLHRVCTTDRHVTQSLETLGRYHCLRSMSIVRCQGCWIWRLSYQNFGKSTENLLLDWRVREDWSANIELP
jgi:hypothetical protein